MSTTAPKPAPRGVRTQYKPAPGKAGLVFGLKSVTSPPPNPHYAVNGDSQSYDIRFALSMGWIEPDAAAQHAPATS